MNFLFSFFILILFSSYNFASFVKDWTEKETQEKFNSSSPNILEGFAILKFLWNDEQPLDICLTFDDLSEKYQKNLFNFFAKYSLSIVLEYLNQDTEDPSLVIVYLSWVSDSKVFSEV